MDRPKASRSARWGTACARCAAAKTRCIRTQSSGPQQCDRCRSMEKDCIDQASVPRKKRQAKPSVKATIALPRDKSRHPIHSSETPRNDSSIAHSSLTENSLAYTASPRSGSSVNTEAQAQITQSLNGTALPTQAYDLTSNALKGPTCSCMEEVNVEDFIPVESDETLLSIYRNQLSSQLPFVVVPASTTITQLQSSRPYLLKAIRMVASVRHLRLIRGQGRAIMEEISAAILLRSERSLDLLQCILVFLGSYHYHCMAHAQFNNLIRLAVSLVEDMNLSTWPKAQRTIGQIPLMRAKESLSRTNEEKRALLGLWYMSSHAGLTVKQFARTGYTEYLDRGLQDLEVSGEYKTDQLAIELVRIQQLTDRIFELHHGDSVGSRKSCSPETPTMARLGELRIEIDKFRDALSPQLKSNCMLLQTLEIVTAGASLIWGAVSDLLSCYEHSACLRIFEPLLAGSHLSDAEPQSFASLSHSGVPILDVFSCFTAALKAWLAKWLAVPICSYFYMPQPAYIQLVHGAMMLTRWVKVAGPDAVQLCSVRKDASHTHFVVSCALSGVPPCPDLDSPRRSTSLSTQVLSAQILTEVRIKIETERKLQIDVLGVLDAMGARFEAAEREITAAQGLEWENDTWEFAAQHVKMKKARIEKWCEIIATKATQGRAALKDLLDSGHETSSETAGIMPARIDDNFGWVASDYDWDNMQWESAMFDDILQDIHT